MRAIRVSTPRHTGRRPQVSTHSFNRAAVGLAPSESVPRGTRAVSAPRAVGCVLVTLGRLPTGPSQATSVPASGPRVPSRASLSVPGAATRPPATRAFAPRSAKQPPPLHKVRPGTAQRSGPGRPGALPACPPGSRLLGCGPWARPQVLGPRPGIAWGRLFHVSTPTRAVSRRTAVRCAPSESVPRGTRAVSAPRAVGCVLAALGRPPAEPSRATSVPASGPRVPSRASLSEGGHATPSERAFAPRSARQPPPLHNVRPGADPYPGPCLRHWGLLHWPTHQCPDHW